MLLGKILSVILKKWSRIIVFALVYWANTGTSDTIKKRCLDTADTPEYDVNTQVCCNGVHERFRNGQDRQCCRKFSHEGYLGTPEMYDTKTSMCCDGIVYNLQPNQMRMGPECCGDQIILNHTAEFCCGQRRYVYTPKHFGCFDRGNETFTKAEGEVICYIHVSPETVKVKVYTKSEVEKKGTSCCGLELYNKRDGPDFCFGNDLWPRGSQPEECGPNFSVHDTRNSVCCQDTGKIIPIPKNYTDRYHGIVPNLVCLNDELVDQDLNRIVYYGDVGHAIPKHFEPCGLDYFEKNIVRGKGICCSGKVHYHRPDMDAMCCGADLIDKTKNNCCNGRTLPKSQMCCVNSTYSISDDVICCAGRLYNNSYLCCRPQTSREIPTLKQKRNDNTCCGNTTYHPLQSTCCDGRLYGRNKVCNLHGEVANISIKSLISDTKLFQNANKRKTNTSSGNQEHKKLRIMDCPACEPYERPYIHCVKRFRYQVILLEIDAKWNQTKIDVLFLEPKLMRKTKMVLLTAGNCKCFKENAIYNLYTNRNFRNRIENLDKFRSRFTARDLFYEVKGNYGYFSTEHRCQVARFYKPVVNH